MEYLQDRSFVESVTSRVHNLGEFTLNRLYLFAEAVTGTEFQSSAEFAYEYATIHTWLEYNLPPIPVKLNNANITRLLTMLAHTDNYQQFTQVFGCGVKILYSGLETNTALEELNLLLKRMGIIKVDLEYGQLSAVRELADQSYLYYASLAEANRKQTFFNLHSSIVPADRLDLRTRTQRASVYNGFRLIGRKIKTVEYHGQLFRAGSDGHEFDIDAVARTTHSRLTAFFEGALN